MHPADYYPVNQEPWPPEGTLTLDIRPEVEATITALKQHFEAVRRNELKRMLGRLSGLNSIQETAIESLTQRIVIKFWRHPCPECGLRGQRLAGLD